MGFYKQSINHSHRRLKTRPTRALTLHFTPLCSSGQCWVWTLLPSPFLGAMEVMKSKPSDPLLPRL